MTVDHSQNESREHKNWWTVKLTTRMCVILDQCSEAFMRTPGMLGRNRLPGHVRNLPALSDGSDGSDGGDQRIAKIPLQSIRLWPMGDGQSQQPPWVRLTLHGRNRPVPWVWLWYSSFLVLDDSWTWFCIHIGKEFKRPCWRVQASCRSGPNALPQVQSKQLW